MSEVNEKWDLIKETVRKECELTDISFLTWIKPLKLHGIEDDTVIIIIPSDQANHLKYISTKYQSFFKVAVSEMLNHTYEVEFKLEKDINDSSISARESKNVYNINSENANLNPNYKFDSFVVGKNNQMAQAAALAVAESPGSVYNPLFIYGGPGLGKTHLMHAIGHFILEQNSNMKVLYVTSEQFTYEVVDTIRSGNEQDKRKLREKYRTVDVLMVDDIQFIIGRDSTQEEFFNTFNALHQAGKAIIISSDKPPKDMQKLDERFRSRFEMGLTVDIQSPDYETRMAILLKKAENYEHKIDREIIEYIATNVKTNIRELEGAFNKMIAFSKLSKEELTLKLAEEALRDIIYPDKPVKVTPKYIIDIVGEHYGIKPDLLISSKRNSEIILPRQVIMYLCCEITDSKLKEIGIALGGRDHTTIMHGRDKIAKDIKKDIELASTIEVLKNKINPL